MLKDMWEAAQLRFRKATKKSLTTPLSFDQALSNLDRRLNPQDSKDGEKHKKMKAAAGNVITFVQLLGGLAAQGASIVFGPANMCFNAFQALLDIPSRIHRLNEHLDLLLEEVSVFMKEFQIYQRIEQITTLDLEFRQSVHKLMIAFVDICALCVEFCDRRTLIVFKQVGKLILFDDDSGVNGALENFRRLSKQHSLISDAVTLERVVQAQHEASGNNKMIWDKLNESAEASDKKFQRLQEGVDILVKEATERKDKEARLETIKKLSSQLGVNIYDKKDNKLIQQSSESLPDSGSWLEDLDTYQTWANLQTPLLIVTGEKGSGKSLLFSTMFRRLEAQYRLPANKTIRLMLACHVFESNEKASQPESLGASSQPSRANAGISSKSLSSSQALKLAAMQFVGEDKVYAKNLEFSLKDNEWKDREVEETFSALFSSTTMPTSKDTFYVLLLDGLEELPREEAKSLVQAALQMKTSQLKVAISVTKDVLDNISDLAMPVPQIKVEHHNEPDIKRYIEYELKHDKLFRSNDSDMQSIVSEMLNKIPDIVNGNFRDVSTIIDSVRNAVESEREIGEILSLISTNTLKNTDVFCEQTIRELKMSLSAQEVQQLNELLAWIIYGRRWFKIDHMRAALFLLMKKKMFQDLAEKVDGKFFKLIRIDGDGDFALRDSEMEDYFRKSPRLKQSDHEDGYSDEPRISMQISVTNAKISQVQRFLWDLSEKVVLDKNFMFNKPLASREPETSISANPLDCNLNILRRCFDLLLNRARDETKLLSSYVTGSMLSHIPRFQGRDDGHRLTNLEKQYIAEQLVYFFQDPEYLQEHLTEQFFEEIHLLDFRDFTNIKTFLSDPIATLKLRFKERNWARKVIEGSEVLFFEGVAIKVANLWLYDDRWQPQLPFQWLNAYLSALKREADRILTQTKAENEEVRERLYETLNEGLEPGIGDIGSTQEVPNEVVSEVSEPVLDPVQKVTDWTEREALLRLKDARRYERLGLTYVALLKEAWAYDERQITLMQKSGQEALKSASALDGHSWRVYEGLADLYAVAGDIERAIIELDIALGRLRLKSDRTDDELNCLVQGLLNCGKWQMQLQRTEKAAQNFEEVIDLTPESCQGRYELLKLYSDTKQNSLACSLIGRWASQTRKGTEMTELGELLLHLCSYDDIDCFETIFDITHDEREFQLVLETLESVRLSAKMNGTSDEERVKMVTLEWSHATALTYYTIADSHLQSTLMHLKECIQLGFSDYRQRSSGYAYKASLLFLNFYVSQAQKKRENPSEEFEFLPEVRQIMDKACGNTEHGDNIRHMLASLYSTHGQQQEAHEILLPIVQEAFGLLSDDDPSNDYWAYCILWDALLHEGDYLNALSAFSLVGPPERHIKPDKTVDTEIESSQNEEDIKTTQENSQNGLDLPKNEFDDEINGWYCNGTCETWNQWTWSSTYWACKICPDCGFCQECFTKFRSGTLKVRLCSQDHEWILTPSWRSELQATGKDKVRMGGTLPPPDGPLQDGRRIGGEIVPVEEWLDSIRKKWGIEKVLVDEGTLVQDGRRISGENKSEEEWHDMIRKSWGVKKVLED